MAKLLTLSAVCLLLIGTSNALEFKDCGEFLVQILFFQNCVSICFIEFGYSESYLQSNYDFDRILIVIEYKKNGTPPITHQK